MEEFLFNDLSDETLSLKDKVIIGLDEAGRGPLAGPVCAGACILGKDFPIEILNDSKKLSRKNLLEAYNIITKEAICYSIAWCTPKEIDELNILWASMKAMEKAYNHVRKIYNKKIDIALVDGNKTPSLDIETKAVIKGDSIHPQIMAASILAKVSRDNFMMFCDKKWPVYGFKKHMGYPTKYHREMIEKFGVSPIHRKSFTFKKVESKQLDLF
ncbi:MAG: ribonuclease HII [Sphaerochaetaceae bacterium]|nr:ribonuclease HII [Sphaerochaetaceae bacterium]MDC7237008.1 ribonuclease HII [Sphaerochaetaceae bacterium]MDC7242757.1 ribonuclease HII [Sphaerochaetaceae bacterium]MDC7249987.1 ribonuclease HII [Sphaerochaetaceae bacterium]